MARFFRTTRPSFIQGNIYTPPISLMQNVLQLQDKGVNDLLSSTDLFKNLNINHLDTEAERSNVENIKQYYNDKANQIASDILKNPLDWRSKIGDINALKRELVTDYREGNISKIQGSYNNMKQWVKDNEHIRKNDPVLFNAAYRNAMSKWAGDSTNSVWEGENILPTPDFRSYYDRAKKDLVPDKSDVTRDSINGNYIVTTKQGTESISPERIMQHGINILKSDPKSIEALKQHQRFGLGRYFDDEGNLNALNPFETIDSNGNVQQHLSINQNNSLAPFLNTLAGEGYRRVTDSKRIRQNTVALAMEKANQARDKKSFHQSLDYMKDRTASDQIKQLKKLALSSNANTRRFAQEQLDDMMAKSFLIPNHPLSESYFGMKNNPNIDQFKFDNIRTELMDNLFKYPDSHNDLSSFTTDEKAAVRYASDHSNSATQFQNELVGQLTKGMKVTQSNPKTFKDTDDLGVRQNITLNVSDYTPEYRAAQEKADKITNLLFRDKDSIYNTIRGKRDNARVTQGFDPFPVTSRTGLAGFINTPDNFNQFNYIDASTGKDLDIKPGDVSKVTHVASSNPRGQMALLVKLKNGKEVIATGKFSPGQFMSSAPLFLYNQALNLLPNSSVVKDELSNIPFNRLKGDFESESEKGVATITMPLSRYFHDAVMRLKDRSTGLNHDYDLNNLEIRKELNPNSAQSDFYLVDKEGNKLNENIPFRGLQSIYNAIAAGVQNTKSR